ncbi:MAG: Holliday junction resolvase RuvX [Patescibacteria group bacterium]
MGKYLGLDYGEKRVGVALTDEEKKFAFAEKTLVVKDEKDLLAQIREICQAESVEKIILGWPVNFAGKKTAQTLIVEKFAGLLKENLAVKCEFQDERLTSRMSYSLFQGKNKKNKVNKNEIDAQSARIILADYLDRLSLKT